MNGIINSQIRRRMLLCAFACACLLSSCTQKETITDVYYIHNECNQSIVIDFGHPLFWDTCSVGSTATYSYVQFETEQIDILPGQVIRLHPICRQEVNPSGHQLDATLVVGSNAKLILDGDTIEWHCAWKDRLPDKIPCMFSDDSTWSIFNVSCWQTIQDETLPYTFYHTFSISETDIERRKTL